MKGILTDALGPCSDSESYPFDPNSAVGFPGGLERTLRDMRLTNEDIASLRTIGFTTLCDKAPRLLHRRLRGFGWIASEE